MQEDRRQGLIHFPCEFDLKIFGLANEHFQITVLTILRAHVPDFKEEALRGHFSKQQKYLALTASVYVKSQAELDAIYQDLSTAKEVVMVL